MMRMEITFEQRNTTLFATLWRDPPKDAAPMERAAHDRIWNALVRFCESNKIGLHIPAPPSSPNPNQNFPRNPNALSPRQPRPLPATSAIFPNKINSFQASSSLFNPHQPSAISFYSGWRRNTSVPLTTSTRPVDGLCRIIERTMPFAAS